MIASRCGLDCSNCDYKEPNNCKGCLETDGQPFYGECPVAVCCQSREYAFCGQCPELPCKMLYDYSCDPVHGDNPPGSRIEQCKRWAANDK